MMIAIILKLILALFISLSLPEIICKKWKLKKGSKKFVTITFKIIAVAVFVYAGVDLVRFVKKHAAD
jgi:hypothetical protein